MRDQFESPDESFAAPILEGDRVLSGDFVLNGPANGHRRLATRGADHHMAELLDVVFLPPVWEDRVRACGAERLWGSDPCLKLRVVQGLFERHRGILGRIEHEGRAVFADLPQDFVLDVGQKPVPEG